MRSSPTSRSSAASIATTSARDWRRPTSSWRRPSVPARASYDYALVRVVPRVERGEFVNAGAILHCRQLDFLDARTELDERRLVALCPDVDLAEVAEHLAALCAV